jgi:hypothetical protein
MDQPIGLTHWILKNINKKDEMTLTLHQSLEIAQLRQVTAHAIANGHSEKTASLLVDRLELEMKRGNCLKQLVERSLGATVIEA